MKSLYFYAFLTENTAKKTKSKSMRHLEKKLIKRREMQSE